MIIHLYVKPSTLMDNTPRESLAKIDRDQTFSLSANIDTNYYKLEWEDETQGVLRIVKRIPIICDTD